MNVRKQHYSVEDTHSFSIDHSDDKKDEGLWRKDVVFKSILRRVRKSYLSEFNRITKYISTKRSHDELYLIRKLEDFAEVLLSDSEKLSNSSYLFTQDFKNELVFFMGAIFYPKHLKSLFESNLKKTEIEVIHSSLYRFTKKKLSHLESYGAYHFLINHFQLKNKQTLLNPNFAKD